MKHIWKLHSIVPAYFALDVGLYKFSTTIVADVDGLLAQSNNISLHN